METPWPCKLIWCLFYIVLAAYLVVTTQVMREQSELQQDQAKQTYCTVAEFSDAIKYGKNLSEGDYWAGTDNLKVSVVGLQEQFNQVYEQYKKVFDP